ncbi:purine nucleosidase [Parabacteroides sp. PF5-5]|uniref:nucleoside hydrolase n=1 Tax=unclassified Parabacteroides TaxID=2649774 RepID=UPI0024734311|nr:MULTISPECIES: nucleoside hydrolase [unclassified Parabacteroides]MDH6304290.1 purine nucleosidase [Parabacteroides sp. PH5-39]MDH6314995.1 purine nucleosidase [Parabacteroides sp. PF5-13]MDH6318655.1 purine nucleosidase [Parabacteroides sp. PH5-13]MDH6322385.1 purine nucleosidase [Parabacteroides sp. PH5-8]MDH6326480.1 purine nucleosidase [Parabacteroides sp. PH5-41]
MKVKYAVFCLLLLCFVVCVGCNDKTGTSGKQVVNLILDTDLGPDYDDVGAMALLHALADSGEVTILATLSSNCHEMVVPCIDVLNTYFGRPDIPLGAPKGENAPNLTTWHKDKWTEYLPAHYPHKVQATSDVPDAVSVYRQLLSKADDQSVTICTVGFFTNLAGLLLSQGDIYSPLNGEELVKQKVKRLVSMAGGFPQGYEFNVYIDTPASAVVFSKWPTEIVFSGFEIGEKILTGTSVIEMDVEGSPVVDTYRLCLAEGDKNGRMSWDQTAVLVSIKGYEPYYNVERGRIALTDEKGSNNWTADENGNHLRLIEKMPIQQVTALIENYMKHQPMK